MAEEEKEHPATAKQRQRFSERGEKVQLKDLSQALVLALTGAVVWATAPKMAASLATVVRVCVAASGHPGTPLFALATHTYWQVVRPILVTALVVVIGVEMVRKRGAISLTPPKFDLARLNPLGRLGQLFSGGQGLVGLAKSFLKMSLVAAICAALLWQRLPALLQHVPASLAAAGAPSLSLIGAMFVRGSAALVIIAALEAWRSWQNLERRMSMSSFEVRDEMKEQMGDQQVRSKIRAKGRELMRQRMHLRVPKADVVVVNPTHLAVALAYDAQKMQAPQVVAKGAGDWAERIRMVARRHRVPIVQDPPLARKLWGQVEVGDVVPGELYQAVAVLLAHVYRLRRQGL